MDNKNALCASKSKFCGVGQMQSTAASMSTLSDEKLPSLSGNSAGQNAGPFDSMYSGRLTEKLSSLAGNTVFPTANLGLAQKHQNLVNRDLTHLLEATKQVDALQKENGQLRALSKELQQRMEQIILHYSLLKQEKEDAVKLTTEKAEQMKKVVEVLEANIVSLENKLEASGKSVGVLSVDKLKLNLVLLAINRDSFQNVTKQLSIVSICLGMCICLLLSYFLY